MEKTMIKTMATLLTVVALFVAIDVPQARAFDIPAEIHKILEPGKPVKRKGWTHEAPFDYLEWRRQAGEPREIIKARGYYDIPDCMVQYQRGKEGFGWVMDQEWIDWHSWQHVKSGGNVCRGLGYFLFNMSDAAKKTIVEAVNEKVGITWTQRLGQLINPSGPVWSDPLDKWGEALKRYHYPIFAKSGTDWEKLMPPCTMDDKGKVYGDAGQFQPNCRPELVGRTRSMTLHELLTVVTNMPEKNCYGYDCGHAGMVKQLYKNSGLRAYPKFKATEALVGAINSTVADRLGPVRLTLDQLNEVANLTSTIKPGQDRVDDQVWNGPMDKVAEMYGRWWARTYRPNLGMEERAVDVVRLVYREVPLKGGDRIPDEVIKYPQGQPPVIEPNVTVPAPEFPQEALDGLDELNNKLALIRYHIRRIDEGQRKGSMTQADYMEAILRQLKHMERLGPAVPGPGADMTKIETQLLEMNRHLKALEEVQEKFRREHTRSVEQGVELGTIPMRDLMTRQIAVLEHMINKHGETQEGLYLRLESILNEVKKGNEISREMLEAQLNASKLEADWRAALRAAGRGGWIEWMEAPKKRFDLQPGQSTTSGKVGHGGYQLSGDTIKWTVPLALPGIPPEQQVHTYDMTIYQRQLIRLAIGWASVIGFFWWFLRRVAGRQDG